MAIPLKTVYLLGLPEAWRAAIVDAIGRAAPDAAVRQIESLDVALGTKARSGGELLVAGPDCDAGELQRAAAARDEEDLPRWAVVGLGRGVPTDSIWFCQLIAPDADLVFQTVQVARSQHGAIRESIRTRGDLWTIARRFNHEMRSPIGCIQTTAETLAEDPGDDPEETAQLTQPILDSAREAMELLDRLTFVARASVDPPTPEPVDMGMAVWAALERLAARGRVPPDRIHEPEQWPAVLGVREWLERVWQELVGNALRHAGRDAAITIGWDRVGDELRFFVRDRGRGVSESNRAMLFRPFHELHRADAGRGLGLSIVRRLISLQGGTCAYASVEPRGSCFSFLLPSPVVRQVAT